MPTESFPSLGGNRETRVTLPLLPPTARAQAIKEGFLERVALVRDQTRGKAGTPGLGVSGTRHLSTLLPGSDQDCSSQLYGWVGLGDWLSSPTSDLRTDLSQGI